MILHKSFKHGWFYHYKFHSQKAEPLLQGELKKLKQYLLEVYEQGVDDEKFTEGPRSSSLKFKIPDLEVTSISNHAVCDLTTIGLEINKERFKTAHSKVQANMLENDGSTIAMEVPLWLDEKEHELMKVFQESGSLTGHIDALSIENNKIVIWDYKPKAKKEKYASTQVYAYAIMLSQRTGIPLEKFLCGYFDDLDCFMFKPSEIKFDASKVLL